MSTKRVSPQWINKLEANEIFVFGSNLEGMHGGGAAAVARKWGAIWGQGVGLQGQTYAIPTMQGGVETIKPYVDEFLAFAKSHPELKFLVTEIGCGIAGFTVQEIAPLFKAALEENIENVYLPQRFYEGSIPKSVYGVFSIILQS
jgi:O-acetyl-ADP-ribose deacetylase (regulator of RNase III)